jgi:hypothetical protein
VSRTDKTKPWRVRVAEHHPIAIHNHEHGTCDLPPSPLTGHLGVYTRGRCTWSDWYLSYDGCCHGCGCRLCTSYYWRREERRSSRHEARRANRETLKRTATDDQWEWQEPRPTHSW